MYIINRVEGNSTKHEEVIKALHTVKFGGVTGEIAFDATGNLRTARVTVFRVIGRRNTLSEIADIEEIVHVALFRE